MSVNDLATIGHSIGFSPTLDNTKSMRYNGVYGALATSSGNGFTNNRAFGESDNQVAFNAKQNTGVGNAAAQYKIGKYYDTSAAGSINNIVGAGTTAADGTIVTAAQLASEFPLIMKLKTLIIWCGMISQLLNCLIYLNH